jgi:hypothetical protein
MAASRWLVNWKYKLQCSNLMYFRNVRYTDIPKISVLKPILVWVFQSYRITDISKFPIYRNFLVYRIKFTHHAYGEIINFCFTQMQSKRSRHFVLKTMSVYIKFLRNSFEMIINRVSTLQIIQTQNFVQISSKEFSYLI